MGGAEISTAISDGILALSALHACIRLSSSSLCAVTGFLLVGSAACFGVKKFGSAEPSESLVSYHKYASWLATVLGMSCIAAAYHRYYHSVLMANLHLAAAAALIILRPQLSTTVLDTATEVVSSAAVVSTLAFSLYVFNMYGTIGALLYAVAGLVVGAEGQWQGIPRVDIFHYVLAVANIALMMGIAEQQPLVYYRPSPTQ